MTKVLLINQEKVAHYRVSVYNRMSEFLRKEECVLTVVSEGIQEGNTSPVKFDHRKISLSFLGLSRLILQTNPDIVIFWVRLRHLYLFPTLFLAKFLRKKTIYWGHGSDLGQRNHLRLKRFANNIEYWLFDALILYAEHLKKRVHESFHRKTFIANNTLDFTDAHLRLVDKAQLLRKFNITTTKNIICCGRMQKRKRLHHLFAAFDLLNRRDVGLILVGPDTEGVLCGIQRENIFILGPIYGNERLELLSASDVFCLPGAVGLSIVDAFYCGLPIVTEDGDESPEIMYLKNGINGFVVPKGDIGHLAEKLGLLLKNDDLRNELSVAARKEIMTNGHIDRMCQGFADAIRFVKRTRLDRSFIKREVAR
jgi:glycosyltransferase involved in cell wall biosynthesis